MDGRTSGMGGRRRAWLAIAVVTGLLTLAPSVASASTVCNSGCDFSSIQAAVNAASPGTTVSVFSGTYNENVVVNKPLTIEGAQHGVDARTRTGVQESILNNSAGAFNLQANDITIDGFTIQEQTGFDQGAGIVVTNQYSGYEVVNNIITDNHFGLYANSSGVNTSLVQHNLFASNNAPGAASGNGIYADQGSKNLTIDANKFTGHVNAGIIFAGSDPSTQSGIQVTNNEDVDDAGFIFFNASGLTVTGNKITNDDVGSSIVAGGNVHGMQITRNTVNKGAFTAVRVADFLGGTPNSDISANGNTLVRNGFGFRESDAGSSDQVQFQFNRVVDNDVQASNELTDPSVQTDAQNNWWGCNKGPGNPGCGTISGNVDSEPWLKFTMSPDKSHINKGGQTDVNVRVKKNSDGDKPAGNVFPDGTPITLKSSPAGDLDATKLKTVNARATTVLHGVKKGTAKLEATLDSQTVKKEVKVD
jgi:nitrous oxidase accessory protein NosD